MEATTTFAWYRNREIEFLPYFEEDDSLVCCKNISGLIEKLIYKYVDSDWRPFNDASKANLKGALLHNGNKYPSAPVAHSTHVKET